MSLALAVANPTNKLGRIKHVVVLYQENRAFDHMFGWDKTLNVSGLTGRESNPVNPKIPSAGSVRVFDGAPYVDNDFTGLEPTHEYFKYSDKFALVDNHPTMQGFVHVERKRHRARKADQVMQGFSQGALPVTSRLAAEFAVFDRWFAAFPGPSWPNHMMSMSGTAAGGATATTPRAECAARWRSLSNACLARGYRATSAPVRMPNPSGPLAALRARSQKRPSGSQTLQNAGAAPVSSGL